MEHTREHRQRIATETNAVLDFRRIYYPNLGYAYELGPALQHTIEHTKCYFPSHPALSLERFNEPSPSRSPECIQLEFLHMTVLQGAQYLHSSIGVSRPSRRVAILNVASVVRTGENSSWRTGASGQEATILRSSTLSRSLGSQNAEPFYAAHDKRKGNDTAGWYSDAMVYSPNIVIFRDEEGGWCSPFEVEVVTCAVVDSREIRERASLINPPAPMPPMISRQVQVSGLPTWVISVPSTYNPLSHFSKLPPRYSTSRLSLFPMPHPPSRPTGSISHLNQLPVNPPRPPPMLSRDNIEHKIREVMKNRITRILMLFEYRGITDLAIGSFGPGGSEHGDFEMVVSIWQELLQQSRRFERSFDRIVFTSPSSTEIRLFRNKFGGMEGGESRRERLEAPTNKTEEQSKSASKRPLKSILKKFPSKQ